MVVDPLLIDPYCGDCRFQMKKVVLYRKSCFLKFSLCISKKKNMTPHFLHNVSDTLRCLAIFSRVWSNKYIFPKVFRGLMLLSLPKTKLHNAAKWFRCVGILFHVKR